MTALALERVERTPVVQIGGRNVIMTAAAFAHLRA
jgi:hypothetical protein